MNMRKRDFGRQIYSGLSSRNLPCPPSEVYFADPAIRRAVADALAGRPAALLAIATRQWHSPGLDPSSVDAPRRRASVGEPSHECDADDWPCHAVYADDDDGDGDDDGDLADHRA